jgi:hypothetical protein
MQHPDYSFKITENVQVRIDPSLKRAVISCETDDRKSLHLEANYKTLDKIHQEIRDRLDRL